MPDNTRASAPGFSPDSASQATRLVDFLRDRYPQVNRDLALAVVRQISPKQADPIKNTAKKLRETLAAHGVSVKHTTSLEAASQMLHGESWQSIRKDAPERLKIMGYSIQDDLAVTDWISAGKQLTKEVSAWMRTHPESKALGLFISEASFLLLGITEGQGGASIRHPIANVLPVDRAPDWLEDLHVCVEYLRRHVEELNHAVVDGAAAVEICARVRESASSIGEPSDLSDLFNSELTLHREDDPNDSNYEICRGDELYCWYQFDLAMEKKAGTISIDEDGAWVIDESRFVWGLETLRPNDIIPGQVKRSLSPEDSRRLLHRYRLAKRIYSNRLPKTQTKLLGVLREPNDRYLVNRHQLMLQLNKMGISWEAAAEMIGSPGLELEDAMPIAVLYSLAGSLKMENPSTIFAAPNRSQLVPLRDGDYIRALLPRVHHVRYRFETGVDREARKAVEEAIADFGTSLAMRNGMFPVQSETPLPDLVYSSDPEDLIGKLAEVNLVAYVGVQPGFIRVPSELPELAETAPVAFGHSLYLAIDKA